MRIHLILLAKLLIISCTALALPPRSVHTLEEICREPGGRTADARVRIPWTAVGTAYGDVRITYCVLHGNADAKLAFERDAEIIYFALASIDKKADRRQYTFAIRTSAGRIIRQGPAVLQPTGKGLLSCRVDVCQFFTEPGERVVSVSVETGELARRR